MSPLTKKAVKDVTRRKLRTTLTVIGIAVGVMGLTAISMASDQMKSGIQVLNDTTGQPDILFFTAPTTAPMADALAGQPNVKLAKTETFASARWAIPTGHEPLSITGLADFENPPFNKLSLTSGHFPGRGEILMEDGDRSVKPFQVGGPVELQVGTSTVQLRVSGTAHTAGTPSAAFVGRAFAYMRESDVQSLLHVNGSNVVLVRLNDYGTRTETARQLGAVLQQKNVTVLASQVGRDVTGGSSSTITGIFTVMQALSVIALLLSVFLLLSTVTTLVAEQVPVIGTMKAIGARSGQVLRNYLTGVAIYGVLGTVIGLALGLALGDLLYRYFAVNLGLDATALHISPALILVAVLVGVGVPLLVAALPIYIGTRITVRQAIAGYGLTQQGRAGQAWTRLASRTLGFLPQTYQMGVRNLFRRRARAALTIAALAVSGAAFLAVQTTTTSWNAVLTDIFGSYQADVFASFDSPQPYSKVRPLIAGVPGVARVEPWSETLVKTGSGSAVLVGLEPGATLYRQDLVSGRWFNATDHEAVVLSQDAAQKAGLKVGDSVEVHTDLYSARWHVVGIARDLLNPTGAGVMLTSLAQANAFNHLPQGYAQSLMIRSASGNPADVDRLAKRVDATLGGSAAQANVTTAQQQVQRNQSVFLILYALFYSVVAIIALVGAIGLFNALAMGVLERRREIGIMRSMGASGRHVAQVFWTEGVGLGLVAWICAVVIGIPAAYGFLQLLGAVLLKAPFTFNPLSMVAMLVFIVAVATIATIGPVWSASRVRIAQTLRYE